MATGFESQASLVCRVFFFSLLFLKVKTRILCTFEKRMMGLNPMMKRATVKGVFHWPAVKF